jgi:hypothetical protein
MVIVKPNLGRANAVKFLCAAVLLLLSQVGPAKAQEHQTTSGWDPFCAVHTRISGDIIQLNARADFVSVRLAVFGDDGVYEVQTTKLPLMGSPLHDWTAPFRIKLPRGAPPGWVYVTSYRLNNNREIACPIETAGFQAQRPPVSLSSVTTSIKNSPYLATFWHALPPLPCKKEFEPVSVRGVAKAKDPGGLTSDVTALVDVLVDSEGHAVKAMIYKSTGYVAADASAAEAAGRATYNPSTFYCMPTVGMYLYSVRFEPAEPPG